MAVHRADPLLSDLGVYWIEGCLSRGAASGDRSGLAHAVWADTRAGSLDSNKQDVAVARAVFAEPLGLRSVARGALRYGGTAIALAGLLALGVALRGGRAGTVLR